MEIEIKTPYRNRMITHFHPAVVKDTNDADRYEFGHSSSHCTPPEGKHIRNHLCLA